MRRPGRVVAGPRAASRRSDQWGLRPDTPVRTRARALWAVAWLGVPSSHWLRSPHGGRVAHDGYPPFRL